MRVIPAVTGVFALALTLAACSTPTQSESAAGPETDPEASVECLASFALADEQAREHYENGPLETYLRTAPPVPEADEEWAEYDAAVAADDAAFAALLDPIYTSCKSTAEFVDGARAYPFVVGLTGPEFIDDITLSSYCFGREETPACQDYESFQF